MQRSDAAAGLGSAAHQGVSVSACLIVRNEERFLEGCLQSLVDKVDEIVVVDTGSTDGSLDILRRFAIEPRRFVWIDDFAAARNCGLDAAQGSWILYIDADERLSLPWGGRLRDYIEPAAVACHVRFRPKADFTRYLEPRLFRADPRLRFEGRIHETMTPRIRELMRQEGLRVVDTAVELDHLGYDGDQSHKFARDLGLLEIAVKEEPDRLYYWNHLAETLAAMGRLDDAIRAGLAGLAAVRRDIDRSQRAEANLVRQSLVRLSLAKGEAPFALIDEGLAEYPDDYGLLFLQAQAYFQAARHAEAIAVTERLLAVDVASLKPGRLAFDEAIFGAASCELAAAACLKAGRMADVGKYYRRAAELAPNDQAARVRAAAFAPDDGERAPT